MVRHDVSTRTVPRASQWQPPLKRSLAGVLLGNDNGHTLLVKPPYRTTWTIPGGAVADGESPVEACGREIREALGIAVTVRRLLCVDWIPPRTDVVDGFAFVFDAGRASAEDIAAVRLNPAEIEDVRFVPTTDFDTLLAPGEARRVRGALAARAHGQTRYLDDGSPLCQETPG